MKRIRYLIAFLAALGLLLGSATPALADGPGSGGDSSDDGDRSGRGSGESQSLNHRHGSDDDDDDDDENGDRDMVTICHLTGAGTFVTLTISGNALAAHDAHGDTISVPAGGCPAVAADLRAEAKAEARVEREDARAEFKAEVRARAEGRDEARAKFEFKVEGAMLEAVLDGELLLVLINQPPQVQIVDDLAFEIVVIIDGQPQVVSLEHLQNLIAVHGLPSSVQFADDGTPMMIVTFDGTQTETAALAVIPSLPFAIEIVAIINGQPEVVTAERLQDLIDVNGPPASVQFANEGTPMVIVTFDGLQPAAATIVLTPDTTAAPPEIATGETDGGDLQATEPQQVTPAAAGNAGFAAADAAVGSLLSLTALALAAMFGSRWVIARKR